MLPNTMALWSCLVITWKGSTAFHVQSRRGDAALFAHQLAAVPARSLLIRFLSMLRCTRSYRHECRRYEHRYEPWYSSLDQTCLHQYKASPPRRAFIRRVPDLTVSPGAIPRFVLPRYCCGSSLYSVRSGRSSFRRAKPPPKSDNAIFGSLPRGQGVAVGESLSGRWGKGGLAAVKGTSRHPALLLQTLVCVRAMWWW
ncbi:hypothetical protein J3F84DRAFT_270793 [Trichoderma pleuroticola]